MIRVAAVLALPILAAMAVRLALAAYARGCEDGRAEGHGRGLHGAWEDANALYLPEVDELHGEVRRLHGERGRLKEERDALETAVFAGFDLGNLHN